MTKKLIFSIILLIIISVLAWQAYVQYQQPKNLASMIRVVHEEFPDVKHISTNTLSTWLQNPQKSEVQLLDVREIVEYETSHIKGAINTPPKSDISDVLSKIDPEKPVVLYCSVGYRSAVMARRLQEEGLDKVYNLEGSIFAWANENRPIESKRNTRNVHPYDENYGKLLNEEKRSF